MQEFSELSKKLYWCDETESFIKKDPYHNLMIDEQLENDLVGMQFETENELLPQSSELSLNQHED